MLFDLSSLDLIFFILILLYFFLKGSHLIYIIFFLEGLIFLNFLSMMFLIKGNSFLLFLGFGVLSSIFSIFIFILVLKSIGLEKVFL